MVPAGISSHVPQAFLIVAIATAPACGSDSAGVEPTSGVQIGLTPAELIMSVGGTSQLQATVTDGEGRTLSGQQVEWSSTVPDIASVSETGLVRALAPGSGRIGAYTGQTVSFARVTVQPDFLLPVPGAQALVITEIGSPAPGCPGGEGGLRLDGNHDCTHTGISRYSIDLADAGQWYGTDSGPAPEVVASAAGTVRDTCRRPPTEVTCGPNGSFVLIQHPGGFSTIYAHLDPASVTVLRKDMVTQGQPLGTMGAWKGDPAPWLHFEVRLDNEGARAAWALDELRVRGRRLVDYKADGQSGGHHELLARK